MSIFDVAKTKRYTSEDITTTTNKTRDYKELEAIEGNRGYSVVGN
jgi:hypothetical protein